MAVWSKSWGLLSSPHCLSHTAQDGWLFPRAKATQDEENNFKWRFPKGKLGPQFLIHPAWIACAPLPKQDPLGYNDPFKKIHVFLIITSSKPNNFQNEQMNFLEPDRRTQERISDRCSVFQLWLQICLEVHHGKNPKWPNFATAFTRLGFLSLAP